MEISLRDLFDGVPGGIERPVLLAAGAALLRGRALEDEEAILVDLETITGAAPFRHMVTPGGFTMSVAMTGCGEVCWITDRKGYRYSRVDPLNGQPWPRMPQSFSALAASAAEEAGYRDFRPDSCLINCYIPGARMSLHQDRDERDFAHPIVSVSLGLPATFQFGGINRADPVSKHVLSHGDVVVWGGPSRLFYHGVLTLKKGEHPRLGARRINLTFRSAL